MIAHAQKPPSTLEEADYSHAEILGVVPEDRSRMFRKRNTSARDGAVINKHLEAQRATDSGADEAPKTADDIELDVPLDK